MDTSGQVSFGLVWLFVFLFYMPQQTAWNLVDYGEIRQVSTPNRYIRFLSLGDPQEFGNEYDRYKHNAKAVEVIRKYIEEYKNDDPPLGLLIPGDCTQTGEDGRYFTPNYLGDYEQRYALGGWESVPIQVYECTGNHDWDTVQHAYPRRMAMYFGKPAAVEMINLRNKYRNGITAQDKQGNYEWVWTAKNGKRLIFWSINVWPSTDKLYSGEPDQSLTFLKQRIQFYSNDPNARFVLLTHYLPNIYGIPNNKEFLYATTLKNTPCVNHIFIFLLFIIVNNK